MGFNSHPSTKPWEMYDFSTMTSETVWGNDDATEPGETPISGESFATQELVLAEAWIKLW